MGDDAVHSELNTQAVPEDIREIADMLDADARAAQREMPARLHASLAEIPLGPRTPAVVWAYRLAACVAVAAAGTIAWMLYGVGTPPRPIDRVSAAQAEFENTLVAWLELDGKGVFTGVDAFSAEGIESISNGASGISRDLFDDSVLSDLMEPSL